MSSYEDALTSIEVDALRQVNLEMTWISHGKGMRFPEYGKLYIGTPENSYRVSAAAAMSLEPERGDVLAREERMGEIGSYDNHNVTPLTIVDKVRASLGSAPALRETPESTDLRSQMPDLDAGVRAAIGMSALMPAAELAKEYRLIDPFVYADAVAASRGIRVVTADAPLQERRSQEYKYLPVEEQMAVRDSAMVKRLGVVAVEMVADNDPRNPKTLGFIDGANHGQGVSGRLRMHDIPHRNHNLLRAKLTLLRSTTRQDPKEIRRLKHALDKITRQ